MLMIFICKAVSHCFTGMVMFILRFVTVSTLLLLIWPVQKPPTDRLVVYLNLNGFRRPKRA